MDRAFITENQIGREIWYFAVCHAEMMLNQVPSRLRLKLTTPFELLHNTKLDKKRFGIFYIGYFNQTVENTESHSKFKSHTLDGIDVGREENSNAIIFYKPLTFS